MAKADQVKAHNRRAMGLAAASQLRLQELKFQLTVALHNSLDLRDMLTNFFRMVTKLVPCSGLEYQLAAQNIRQRLGQKGRHKVQYTLNYQKRELGEIIFTHAEPFSESEQIYLESMTALLVNPLRNALLYREALASSLRDGLTGIGNRAALEISIEREFKLYHRTRQAFSLLCIDIDHFKAVNDRHGHAGGDTVLRTVTEAIQKTLRQTDQVFRFGGEEFVVALQNTGTGAALGIAERIRGAIAGAASETATGRVAVTASIGVCTSRQEDTRDALFTRGDKALYAAKNQGRNRVVGQAS